VTGIRSRIVTSEGNTSRGRWRIPGRLRRRPRGTMSSTRPGLNPDSSHREAGPPRQARGDQVLLPGMRGSGQQVDTRMDRAPASRIEPALSHGVGESESGCLWAREHAMLAGCDLRHPPVRTFLCRSACAHDCYPTRESGP
jgi:hypothetical protein